MVNAESFNVVFGRLTEGIGQENGLGAPSLDECDYEFDERRSQCALVGVVEDGKIRLCDAKVFTIKSRYVESDARSTHEVSENKSFLVESFGSSKNKRLHHSYLLNKVDETSLNNAIDTARNLMGVSSNAISIPIAEPANDFIPSCNKNAKRPEDVYNIEDIFSSYELEGLCQEGEKLATASAEQIRSLMASDSLPYFVCDHLIASPTSRSTHFGLIEGLRFMLQLYHMKAKTLKSNAHILMDAPEIVRKKLLETFTVEVNYNNSKQRCIPSRLKDKLICHILIVSLVIANFKLKLSTIQKDLKIGIQRLCDFCHLLGCTIFNVKDPTNPKNVTKIAHLTIPLSFPEPRALKRKHE